jgi:biotin carboxyl carrier protein
MKKYITTINDKQFEIEIDKEGTVKVNGVEKHVDFLSLGASLYSVIMGTTSMEVIVEEREGEVEVLIGGRKYSGKVLDERAQLLASRRGGTVADTGEISIKAPMPGLVVAIPVKEGDEVKKGQTVLILESMKMQNELKAPRDGMISRISAEAKQSVEQGKVLVTMV